MTRTICREGRVATLAVLTRTAEKGATRRSCIVTRRETRQSCDLQTGVSREMWGVTSLTLTLKRRGTMNTLTWTWQKPAVASKVSFESEGGAQPLQQPSAERAPANTVLVTVENQDGRPPRWLVAWRRDATFKHLKQCSHNGFFSKLNQQYWSPESIIKASGCAWIFQPHWFHLFPCLAWRQTHLQGDVLEN